MAYLKSYLLKRGNSDDVACIRYDSALQDYTLSYITKYDSSKGVQLLKYPGNPYASSVSEAQQSPYMCLLHAKSTERKTYNDFTYGGLGMFFNPSSVVYDGFVKDCTMGMSTATYNRYVGLRFSQTNISKIYTRPFLYSSGQRPSFVNAGSVTTPSTTSPTYILNSKNITVDEIGYGVSVLFKVDKSWNIDTSVTPQVVATCKYKMTGSSSYFDESDFTNCRVIFSDSTYNYWYGSVGFPLVVEDGTFDDFRPAFPVIRFKDRTSSGGTTMLIYLSAQIVIY